MNRSKMDRRTLVSVGTLGVVGSAFGGRMLLAQENDETDADATPEATPGASPEATPANGDAEEFTVEMVDIDFNPNEFTIPADTDVTIVCPNLGDLEHDFVIEDTDYRTDVAQPGETVEVTVNLEAGEYIYFCSIPGHRESGMEGTLTVE